MTVVVLSDCPPKLRGDITKWLFEINTGVYVGNISGRVREELWDRITENIGKGRASMVTSAQNEQGLDFRVFNTLWEPVDYDGIKLMRRPLCGAPLTEKQLDSSISQRVNNKKIRHAVAQKKAADYVIIDVETTGIDTKNDEIIEIAALSIQNGQPADEYQTLVRHTAPIPSEISELTGITEQMINEEGISLGEAVHEVLQFIGDRPIVCHNAAFDVKFLMKACMRNNYSFPNTQIHDTLRMAREKLHRGDVPSYKLTQLAEYFGIDTSGAHRALRDCELTYRVFIKLNEIL